MAAELDRRHGWLRSGPGKYRTMHPLRGRVRGRVRRAVLQLETQASDDPPLLCGCEEAGDGPACCD